MKKILLIDGNSLMFRSYYATAYTGNLMKTKDGVYTNALFGFVNMLNKLLDTTDYMFVAFDAGKKTFRHQAYEEYKGTRKPLPEELRIQIPLIKEYLDIIKVKRMESFDYEADDLLATVATRFKNEFDELIVITGDHDLLQLVDDKIKVGLTKKGVGDIEYYTKENFFEKVGLYPDQIIEYKGIFGDTSDNLPGIKGVGDKTAVKLLNDYHNIEGIYEHLDSLTTRVRNLFIEGKASAEKCRYLATLEKNANIDITEEDLEKKQYDTKELVKFFTLMEFTSFLKRIKQDAVNQEALEIEKDKKTIQSEGTISEGEYVLDNDAYIIYEIVGSNYIKDEFLGISLVINENKYFINENELTNIKEYLENPNYKKNTYDYKGLYYLMKKHDIDIKGVCFDLLIDSYLINPNYANDDFKVTCGNFIDTTIPYYENIYGANTKIKAPEEKIYKEYSISKALILKSIKTDILKQIEKLKLNELVDIEMNLSKVLATMEINGLKIDLDRLDEIGVNLNEKCLKYQKHIYEVAGENFNLNSPKQLGEILFDKLKLPHGKKNKTGYSTNVDVLEKLKDYEIVKDILEYRGLSKLITTYVNGLKDIVVNNYIHPLFKQTLTTTGRLSSVEPNIQNMPIRTEQGQVIREIFISRFDNGVIISADYSQIELRVLAHMSNDDEMVLAFNSHIDIHTKTASQIYEVSVENVTKDMRRTAKTINFGIIYGMSPWGLSESLGITPLEANIFINKYFANYPKAKECLDNYIRDAYTNGYSETMLGRRRYIPELKNTNAQVRSFGERTAMNSPIQGTAADIIKIAMNKVQQAIWDKNLKTLLIAQVHDELVFDVPANEKEIIKELVKEAMEHALKLVVPLEIGIAEGKNWFEAK